MGGLFKKYGFAAIVAGALAAMALVVAGKSVFGGVGALIGGQGGPSAPGAGMATGVNVAAATPHLFTDGVQAIGTAQARESIIITPKVADTIRVIRFDSGDRVRAGQVLVEMSSVEQIASVAEARAANEAAQEELRRFQELYDRGFASQARIDAVRAAADAARARLNAGDSRAADRTLRAPFAGVVGLRTASPGQYVTPGTQIGTLDDIAEIKLDFDVTETQIARLAPGVAIIARTAAFPDRTFQGTIDHVDTRVNPATRTVRVRAVLPNADEALRAGMLMTVDVRSNPREALSVPEIAILEQAGASYVYRVNSSENGHVAERVAVTTGQRAGGAAEILSGLTAGDLVVIEGVQSMRPGAPVHINNAAAADGGAPSPAAGELRPRG
ncbi:MAG: efflux RND transporter periplasmic adaptor subunit [Terricaulis sp.]|nr:efflux RND transporter periplasmic adaptor subunit [Terricaulis sp.]